MCKDCDGQPGLMCGYSNCFRPKVGRRGCAVHKADPRKWPDGRFTGSTWKKVDPLAKEAILRAQLRKAGLPPEDFESVGPVRRPSRIEGGGR